MEQPTDANATPTDDFGRGVPLLDDGTLDQDALWEIVADDHPELDTESEREERTSRSFEDADPYVHLQCHVLVENQLHADEPRQVRKALAALQAAGLERHDAVHGIAAHAFELLVVPMGADPVGNERQYVGRLKQLIAHPEFAAEQ